MCSLQLNLTSQCTPKWRVETATNTLSKQKSRKNILNFVTLPLCASNKNLCLIMYYHSFSQHLEM